MQRNPMDVRNEKKKEESVGFEDLQDDECGRMRGLILTVLLQVSSELSPI